MFRIFVVILSSAGNYPFSEFFFTNKISMAELRKAPVTFSSRVFRIEKLEPPYIDNCFKYDSIGFLNRQHGINSYLNQAYIDYMNKNSRQNLFLVGVPFPMATRYEVQTELGPRLHHDSDLDMFEKPDCVTETHFTDHKFISEHGSSYTISMGAIK